MTILWGDTGLISVGAQKTYTTTLATPNEVLLPPGSEIVLPTADPGTNQVSFTVQESDLPTINPTPYSVKYSAYVVVSGKNATGASVSVTYTCYKNGVAVTGAIGQAQSGIANNMFWTHTHYRFYDVVPGDVLEVRCWSNTAGVTLDYYSLLLMPTRMELTKSLIVQDLSLTLTAPQPYLKGAPGYQPSGSWNVYPTNSATLFASMSSSFNQPVAIITSSSNGFLGRINNGDTAMSTGVATHSTGHPQSGRNLYPSVITFREVWR